MRTLFVVASLLVAALAASEIEFIADANLTNAEVDFKLRYTMTTIFANLFTWTSASVDASVANASAKASADILFGVGCSLPLLAPAALATYVSGKAELGFEAIVDNMIAGKVDATISAGMVFMAVPKVEEVNKKGETVTTYLLNQGWGPMKLTTNENKTVTRADSDAVLVLPLLTPAKVKVSFVTSQVAGILKYGHTPVSPNSLEMIIAGSDFPLADENNNLRLTVALITASAKGEVKGNAQVRKINGTQVYAAVSRYAIIDGKRVKVNVKIKSGSEGEIGDILTGIVKGAFGTNYDVQVAKIDFPKGKKEFVYDPAVGAGKNIYDAGASTAFLSLLAVVLCALLALF